MASLNRVELIGNVGQAPELRHTPSGMPVLRLSVATNERRKDKKTGEVIENTQWHQVTFFGQQAEFISQYIGKGREVYVEARLEYGRYEKDGETVYTTDVIGRRIMPLGPVPAGQRSAPEGEGDDDVPF
jgi:single-strand DNA-binding protein